MYSIVMVCHKFGMLHHSNNPFVIDRWVEKPDEIKYYK